MSEFLSFSLLLRLVLYTDLIAYACMNLISFLFLWWDRSKSKNSIFTGQIMPYTHDKQTTFSLLSFTLFASFRDIFVMNENWSIAEIFTMFGSNDESAQFRLYRKICSNGISFEEKIKSKSFSSFTCEKRRLFVWKSFKIRLVFSHFFSLRTVSKSVK